ncbi:MAG: type II toxin-antitoxin system VapC family toxin [Verrucomicrobia bacterium]|nr:MAG: type II toxin-antitoxin system VapC family toxin [Verrucomicrobiota bacterium]
MIGLDTSFLVAWAIPEHRDHLTCRRLAADAVHCGRAFGLTVGILAEFIHVVTDPRRFATPLTMADATAIASFWAQATEVALLPQSASVATIWLDWQHRHRLGRKRLLDTLIAATWHGAHITEVFTLNPADFEIFGVFTFVPVPVLP